MRTLGHTYRRRGGLRRRAVVGALALALTAPTIVTAVASSGDDAGTRRTAHPGGTWEPGPASYAVLAETGLHVPMSDGVELTVDVYYPANLTSGRAAAGRFPVLLQQTPYTNTTGTEQRLSGETPGGIFVERGYIYVSADVRGTGRSAGEGGFFSRRDALDGVDLVHWAAKLPRGNGVVGLAGCSYLAQAQVYTAALLGPHSPVKAMAPTCVSGDVYRDTYFENGIPTLAWHGAGLASGTLLGPTIERYLAGKYAQSQAGGDPAFYGKFWSIRDHIAQARAVAATGIPALMWVGWDEPGFGGQELYAALQNAWAGRSPFARMRADQRVTGRYQLVVGDWGHGGGLDPGIELQWFDTWLKREDTGLDIHSPTPMHLQERPTGRWVNTATYPMTARYRRLFLGDGALGTRPAAGTGALVYGPPQPGNTLTFTSAPFADGALLAGPLAAQIYASSTTANLELMADVYDLAPDGSTALVAHGGIVGSLHERDARRTWVDVNGLPVRPYLNLHADRTVPAGMMRRYDVPIQPAFWSLAPGHRLQLVLAAQPDPMLCMTNGARVVARVIGCLPRPEILAQLTGGRYAIAWGGRHASSVTLPVMPLRTFPTVRSGATPTSSSVALPLDWSSPR